MPTCTEDVVITVRLLVPNMMRTLMCDPGSTPLGSRTQLRNGEASAVQLSSSCQVVTTTPWAESLEMVDSLSCLAHPPLTPPS